MFFAPPDRDEAAREVNDCGLPTVFGQRTISLTRVEASDRSMHIRNIAALIVSMTLLGCGSASTPAAPTSAAGLNLVDGTYRLTLSMSSSGEPTCNNNGVCLTVSLCGGGANPPSLRPVITMARLERIGDQITLRAEDPSSTLVFDLRIAGNALSGTASGQLREGALQIVVGEGHAAIATGLVLPTAVTGKLDGQLSTGGYSCSNNGHTWALSPQ